MNNQEASPSQPLAEDFLRECITVTADPDVTELVRDVATAS